MPTQRLVLAPIANCRLVDRELATAAVSIIDAEFEADADGKISSAYLMGRLSLMDPAESDRLQEVGANFLGRTLTTRNDVDARWNNYLDSCDPPNVLPSPRRGGSALTASTPTDFKPASPEWLAKSRQQVKSAIQKAADAQSRFEGLMHAISPESRKGALAALRNASDKTVYLDPGAAGGVSEVNTVDKTHGEVTTLKAQAGTLISRLNQA